MGICADSNGYLLWSDEVVEKCCPMMWVCLCESACGFMFTDGTKNDKKPKKGVSTDMPCTARVNRRMSDEVASVKGDKAEQCG